MKKVFALFLVVLLPLTTSAQDKIITEINNYFNDKPQKMTLQELNSKIVNEWDKKELRFLELKNGRMVLMTAKKSNNLLKDQEIQKKSYEGLIYGIIIILALVIYVVWATGKEDDD